MRRASEVRLTQVALLGAAGGAAADDPGEFIAFLNWIEAERVRLPALWRDDLLPAVRAGAMTDSGIVNWNNAVMAFQRAVLHAHGGLVRAEATANAQSLPDADTFLRRVLRGPGDRDVIPIFAHGPDDGVVVAEPLPAEGLDEPAVALAGSRLASPLIIAAIAVAGFALLLISWGGYATWSEEDRLKARALVLREENDLERLRRGLPPLPPVPDEDADTPAWARPIFKALGWTLAGGVVLGAIWGLSRLRDGKSRGRPAWV